MGNFYSLCLLHVPCNWVQKEIIKYWKKNYWALFWCINSLVPSCTEGTVLLNVYPVFVSKIDFVNLTFDNIRLLIEERITTLSKMFLLFKYTHLIIWYMLICAIPNNKYYYFYSSFLSRIQKKKKKVEGQTFLGFVLLKWLSLDFVAGKTIFRW